MQLIRKLSPFLNSPKVWAVAIPGAFGGLMSWLLEIYPAFTGFSPGLFVSIIFGIAAGLIIVVLVINSSTHDIPRMLVLSFLSGLIWFQVIEKGLNLVTDSANGAQLDLSSLINTGVTNQISTVIKFDDPYISQQLEKGNMPIEDDYRIRSTEDLANLVSREGARQIVIMMLGPSGDSQGYIESRENNQDLFLDFFMLSTLGPVNISEKLMESTLTDSGREVAYQILNGLNSRPTGEDREYVPLEFNRVYEARFTDYDDNWFSFSITDESRGLFRFEVFSADIPEYIDLQLELFNSEDALIGSDYSFGDYAGLDEWLQPGEYSLKVSNLISHVADYELEILYQGNAPGSEVSVDIPSANEINELPVLTVAANAVPDMFDSGEEVHWYRVTFQEAGDYIFETSANTPNEEVDTVITLYAFDSDEDKVYQVGEDDDGGENLYSRLSEFLVSSTENSLTYLLKVESYNSRTGYYEVALRQE